MSQELKPEELDTLLKPQERDHPMWAKAAAVILTTILVYGLSILALKQWVEPFGLDWKAELTIIITVPFMYEVGLLVVRFIKTGDYKK